MPKGINEIWSVFFDNECHNSGLCRLQRTQIYLKRDEHDILVREKFGETVWMCAKVNEQEITRTRQIIKNNCHLPLLVIFVSGSECPIQFNYVISAKNNTTG